MIRLAARLKWALLRGGLRSGPGSTQRQIGMALSVALGGVLGVLGLVVLSTSHGRPLADDASILVFTFLVTGWSVLPILTFASDDLLDPAKLAPFPLSKRQVLVLHGVGALVGVAPVATTMVLLGAVIGTSGGPGSALVAVIAAVLELALCVVLSRTVVSALSRLLRSRRGRDLGVALVALVSVSINVLNPILQRVGREAGTSGLHRMATAVSQLPPGLLAAAPRHAREGHVLQALTNLLVTAVLLAVLLVLWERSLRRAEEVPDATTSRKVSRTGGLVPRWLALPAGRVGAIAGKDIRYLTREPRRLVQIATSAILPLVLIVVSPSLSSNGPTPGTVFAICGMALLLGLQGANRFGQEGTASWALVASGAGLPEARKDLLGTDLAFTLLGLPLMLTAGCLVAVLTNGWHYLPTAFAVAVSVLFLSFGGAGLLSVLAPFPIPEGPRNAFSNGGGGQGFAAGMLGLLVMCGIGIVFLPELALLLPALDGHRVWLLLFGAPLYGLAVGSGLREVAARLWVERAPEVLQKISAQR